MHGRCTLMSRHFPLTRREMRKGLMSSQALLEQAGLIRAVAPGIYALLPLGFEVHQRICAIIYEEMAKAGVHNCQLPILQPSELWKQSGRWQRYTDSGTMYQTTDNHTGHVYGLAPTAEEVVTTIAAMEVTSHRQLPLHLHQIGPKFRNEVRPRMGLLRCREFGMSDAYSFDADEEGMRESFAMYRRIYDQVFARVGLRRCISVQADSGAIGGQGSAEFMALSGEGDDVLLTCGNCDYGANAEKAESLIPEHAFSTALKPMHIEDTPGVMTVEQLQGFFPGIEPWQMVKTIIFTVDAETGASYEVAVCIRGDLEVNTTKVINLLGASSVTPADASVVREVTGAEVGFAGPIGLENVRRIIFDHSVALMTNFLCGVNQTGKHALDVNIGRDFRAPNSYHDVHLAKGEDVCAACGGGVLNESRGIEVGHVFMLQQGYAEKLGATFMNAEGQSQVIWMGCYGIGTTRLLQAIVEQNRDDRGIIWPVSVAPYDAYVMPINASGNDQAHLTDHVCQDLVEAGYNVLKDDRDAGAGMKFADADLIGCPWRITVGRGTKDNNVEIRSRQTSDPDDSKVVHVSHVVSFLKDAGSSRS